MFRRLLDSNLLDLDLDSPPKPPDPPSGAAGDGPDVPNFSILSSATTGNIKTLAGEPTPPPLVPTPPLAPVQHIAGCSAVANLCDSDLDDADGDIEAPNSSNVGVNNDDLEAVINTGKLQELANLLSMFSPHLNELTQQQLRLAEAGGGAGCSHTGGVTHHTGCPFHGESQASSTATIPPSAPSSATTSSSGGGRKSRKKKRNNQNGTVAPVSTALSSSTPPPPQSPAASSNGVGAGVASGISSATTPASVGNHVWISAASCHGEGDDNGDAGVDTVFKEMEDQILPFLKNTYVSEYRFPFRLSAAEKKALKQIASERDLDCVTVDEGKERYVALKKRLGACNVETTIDQLEKQARKTLSLVKMLTEKRAACSIYPTHATGGHLLPPVSQQPNTGTAPGGPNCLANIFPFTTPVAPIGSAVVSNGNGLHPTTTTAAATTAASAASLTTAAKVVNSNKNGGVPPGKQVQEAGAVANGAVAKKPAMVTQSTTASDTNNAGHEISIQANAHELPGKKQMIDVGLQTCPEGWYVCQYCEQDIPENEQVSHRSACLAEHRERIVQRAAEADRRRMRRRRRQLREPSDQTDQSEAATESEARARLSRIHDNDLDSLLKTVQQMDTKCNTRGCSVKAQPCQQCRHPFCHEHMRHHGCSNPGPAPSTSTLGTVATTSTSSSTGVSCGTDTEGPSNNVPVTNAPSAGARGSQQSVGSGGGSELSYFERSQLRRNLKQKMAALKERRK